MNPSHLPQIIQRLEIVANSCEASAHFVTFSGTDMREHAADIRAVIAQLASAQLASAQLASAEGRVKELGGIISEVGKELHFSHGEELPHNIVLHAKVFYGQFLAERESNRHESARVLKAEARVKELEAQLVENIRAYEYRHKQGLDCYARLRAVTEAMRDLVDAERKHVDEGDAMTAQTLRDAIETAEKLLTTARSADLPPHPDTERLAFVAKHYWNAIRYCVGHDGDDWRGDFVGTLDRRMKREQERMPAVVGAQAGKEGASHG